MPKTALVAGATGLVGRTLLEELSRAPAYGTITAVVRKAPRESSPTVRLVEADFDHLEALGPVLAADDVFCCLGTTMRKAKSKEAFRRVDLEYPLVLARAARAQGAQQFLVISSIGAHPEASSFYLRTKGEMEEALGALGFACVIILRPSVLLGPRGELRPGEALGKFLMRLASPLLQGGVRKYRPIQARIVARAMVTLAGMGLYGRHIVESDGIEQMGW